MKKKNKLENDEKIRKINEDEDEIKFFQWNETYCSCIQRTMFSMINDKIYKAL